jgi:glyoxylase-like metal-dependent hydrolase (beta-lactamase superfamily II)
MTQNNCNTYLINGTTRILVDPGHLSLFGHVEKGLAELKLTVEDIGLVICTHAHPDHIEAVPLFKKAGAQVTMHKAEWLVVKQMEQLVKTSFGVRLNEIAPDFFIDNGNLSVSDLEFTVFHTPGHSPGSICLYWNRHRVLFTGDLVFKEGIGRTDLPGGNGKQIKNSIKNIASLDIEQVLPGHGEVVSGRDNVRKNFDSIETYWFKFI